MRFAPPKALRVANPAGLNQTNVRTHNERIVLSLLRQHEGLSKVEIGQVSGLSSQAVSVIVRALEEDGLCKRGSLQKGKVGPPSTPMQINPDGAFSIGVHVGGRSADILLLDFAGAIRDVRTIAYPENDTRHALAAIAAEAVDLMDTLPKPQAERTVGIGLAVPADIDAWALPEAPDPAAAAGFDIEAFIAGETGLGVYVQDDVAAAITGEVLFGAARDLDDFAYLFVGRHSELRLVMNHRIQSRPSAADLTALPAVPEAIEQALAAAAVLPDGIDGDAGRWLADGAATIAARIAALMEFIELETVVVDGRLADDLRKQLVIEIAAAMAGSVDVQRARPEIRAGDIGIHCKAYGAACLPVYARYMLEEVSLP